MATQKESITDIVIKIAEIMTVFQNSKQNEDDVLKTLQGLLELVNVLDDVEKTYYLNDIEDIVIIPSKGALESKALNENADKILREWIRLKEKNNCLKFISMVELLENGEETFPESFDNLNIDNTVITEAAGRQGEKDLFIIEKKTTHELSDYEKNYIEKVSKCAKSINENVFLGEQHIENEQILTQVLDNIDAMIYVSDLETEEVLFVNDTMKKTFNLAETKKKVCWQIFQEGFKETCSFCPVRKLNSVHDDAIVWEEHNTVTNQYYQNTDRLINWIDGRVVHIQHSVDITKMKNAEYELKLAIEKAEENAQAKSEFLSKMSHELRTPLNAIIGMISIIEKSNDIEKITGFIQKMKSASSNLLQTINDILDISKIEAGKMEFTESLFNMDDMFRGIFDIIEFAAHNKDITIESDIEISKNEFIGDSKRISQVYMNLLSNAVKFTNDGGKIIVSVKYNRLPNGKIEVISSVKDNGVGIPKDKIETLFQSFVQVDNSLSRQYNGTGLGLFISKNIIELMGGKITIDSVLGEGATFSFNFILNEDKSEKQRESIPDMFNVLVIDDSEETCIYLDDLFTTRNIKHTIVSSGEEGIRTIKDNIEVFNVILVDYMMPSMNGLETVKKLRTIVDTDTIIIMISSYDWDVIEEDAKGLGINKFLAKPLLPSDVINAISEIYKKKEIVRVEEEEIFDFNGKTVLLFEDVDINREIVHFLLEDTGAKCVDAADGEIGVNIYNQNPEKYDLILMDIQMPNMDGFEATKLIRESSATTAKTVPIIAMTANVFAEQIKDTLEAGMNAHLGKPVNELELKRELKNWLN